MALTEETKEDKIEIVGDFKHVQVRTAAARNAEAEAVRDEE